MPTRRTEPRAGYLLADARTVISLRCVIDVELTGKRVQSHENPPQHGTTRSQISGHRLDRCRKCRLLVTNLGYAAETDSWKSSPIDTAVSSSDIAGG